MALWQRLFVMAAVIAQAPALVCAAEPKFTGQLVFHRYTSYEAWDSKLYLYDYKAQALSCLSANWPIDHAMNAHFSPDGKSIVFMGVPRGQHNGQSWDVFWWDLASARNPINLTAGNGARDEDPNFSPDGKTIVFKQDGRLKLMDVKQKTVRWAPGFAPGVEWSMPVFTANGRSIVAMAGARASGDLYAVNLDSRRVTPIATTPGIQE